ncbi:MAG: hypothetical protein ABI468_11535, partial [Candidatus Nanopelagicales bacterium]
GHVDHPIAEDGTDAVMRGERLVTDACQRHDVFRRPSNRVGLQGVVVCLGPTDGSNGAPYLIFYGDVSEDSDGPLELCRPIRDEVTVDTGRLGADVQVREEGAHDEVYVRLTQSQMGWPAMLPVVDALDAWATSNGRNPAGALRQVLIADQRTATADTLVCDLTVPLS